MYLKRVGGPCQAKSRTWYSAYTMDKATIPVPIAIIIAGALIAGAIFLGLYYSPQKGGADVAKEASPSKIPPVSADDHVVGNPTTATLTLVEYSDLQCPFCSRFHPTVEQIVKDYGGKVAWAYRQFPLSSIHPEALPAAIASECVATLKGNDAFFAFANGIFENQQRIGVSLYHEQAGKLGISTADLDACIAKADSKTKIQDQFNDAVAAGGQGTPFTVILNKKGETVGIIPGALPLEQVKAQIDALLKVVK